MSAKFEEVVVKPAVSAEAAVTKKVMVLTVDRETKRISDMETVVAFICLGFYAALLVVLWWAFFHYDILNEPPCSYYYHGGCDDGTGLPSIIVPVCIVAVLALPTYIALFVRAASTGLLLKMAGWDGTSEYRLEVEE